MADVRPVLLVSFPRSASNLLVRMLALDDQPAVAQNEKRGYHLMAMATLPQDENLWDRPLSRWGDNNQRLRQAAEDGFRALEKTRAVGIAEKKIAFSKEHATLLTDPSVLSKYIFAEDDTADRPWRMDHHDVEREAPLKSGSSPLNDTMFSDAYLQQWDMVFLIRHPALAFPSLYRIFMGATPDLDVKKGTETFSPPEGRTWPLLLDADDVVANPMIVEKFAALIGMDPSKVQSTWSPLTAEEREKMSARARIMLSTLNASNGLMADKSAAGLDLDDEARKWEQEFGPAAAAKLERWVREAMPDYEYLRDKRLRL
ncbi:importin beta-5 subunit [Purpureocillium lavendulum]|uniref:Importin beta-5 subunit n=1 Tax=Purpureocillium lavendulum TaxID=1247861 RepID=A0AB34GAT2_9HYPO|nr:importin beta-5 subunit [Purpureocillium lavendulum]